MSDPDSAPRLLRFDVFELDVRAGELRKRGVKLRLQGQPLLLLASLLQRAGDLVTREELRAQIWPADTFVDFDHSLHNAVARLRDALGDSSEKPRFIETLPRRGYRFIGSVTDGKGEENVSVRREREPGALQVHGIAVLPLEDLSGDQAHEYFADGMTEALITSLAKIKALRVISRTSAMQYKGARKALPQIARELNVDAVIEGSVLRSGERVRINAQLIHAASDQHLWAESYERDFRDVLSLQSEIAGQVAHEVKVFLTPEERQRLKSDRAVNPQAHEFYLKARYYWNRRTEEGVKKALAYFQSAIDEDPTYAQGYAGVADAYHIFGYYNVLSPGEAYPKAKAAALKAAELDPGLAEPHATLGVVKRDFEWEWAGADAEFQRATEINPGYVEAHHWRSTLISMLGRHEEGIFEKKKALALDPLSVVIRTDLARMLYFARDPERSLEECRAAIEMDPNFAGARLGLGQVYLQQGRFEEAIAELEIGVRLASGSPFALARLAHGYAVGGQLEKARAGLEQLLRRSHEKYVSPYDVALVHIGLRQIDEAFREMDRALEQRSLWMGYLKVEPQMDPLRSDPRFQRLLREVGLATPPRQ
jgi:TolB-like protein